MYNSIAHIAGFQHSDNPAWYRARLSAIRKLLDELPSSLDKDKTRNLLRNGFVPEDVNERFLKLVDFEYKLTFALNNPLSFAELTSFDTWFAMHPEKICGKQIASSSREFPITVKGSKTDIIQTISKKTVSNETDKTVFPTNKTISEIELQALAVEVELQLLKL